MVLDPKLQKFTTASQAVVSYPFTDIENGTGTNIYYAGSTIDSAGTTYILTTQTSIGAGDNNNKAVLQGNEASHDFDLTPFTVPKTVTGTATISCTNYNASLSSSCTFRLKKWDGSSETNVSGVITSETNSVTKEILISMPLTKTVFAAGDILRLTIDFNGSNTGQGIGIDPSGQSTNTGGSLALQPFKITVPFKLDI